MGKHTRREFARRVGALAAGGAVSTSWVHGTQQPQSEEYKAEVDALLAQLEAKFPERFTSDQKTSLRRDLQGLVRTSQRMSKSNLSNSDEPDFIFSAADPHA